MPASLALLPSTSSPAHQQQQPSSLPGPLLASVGLHLTALLALAAWNDLVDRHFPPERIQVPPPKVTLVFRRFEPLPKVSPPPLQIPVAPKSSAPQLTFHQAAFANLRNQRARQFTLTPPPVVKQAPLPSIDVVQVPPPAIAVVAPPPPPPQRAAVKTFQPPVPREKPRLEVPTEMFPGEIPKLRETTPNLNAIAGQARSRQIAAGKPTPEIEAPPQLAGDRSNATVPMVILNATPGALPPVADPSASRDGQIARASEVGPPAIRASAKDGLRIPNVAIDRIGDAPPAPPPAPPVAKEKPPAREVQYQRSLLGGAENSVSVPLRPGVRTIPADIEKIFAGRNVYTMLIPMSNNPEYLGDWTIWFGEHPPVTAEGRVMAPLPRVKKVPVGPRTGRMVDGRIRAQITIQNDGKVADVTLLACSNPLIRASAEEDLKQWEFRPAKKSGTYFVSDVVIDLTLRCPVGTE